MEKTSHVIWYALALLGLAACGGGGGGNRGGVTQPTYAVAVTITGLAGSGLVLSNNGSDSLTVATNGQNAFSTRLGNGAAYSVTVTSQPQTPSQTCAVANPAGAIAAADVNGITVTCTTNRFGVGGTISGLTGNATLQINGGDDLAVATNGTFTFGSPLNSGAAYSVTVLKQPDLPPQRCFVDSGLGTVGNGPVTSLAVGCETQYPRFAYTLNTGDGSVSIYNIDSTTGQLRARGSAKTGAQPLDLVTTGDGKYRYVFNSGAATVSAYARDGLTGELTEITGSPIATGAAASTSGAMAVHPNNRFIYVANGSGGNSVSAFASNSAGALTAIAGNPFAAGTVPSNVTVHPSGRFAYVANATSRDIYAYAINADTGALTEVTDGRIATGADPASFNLHPNGRFAYVPNTGGSTLSAYAVDLAGGKLTAIAGGAAATGVAAQGKVLFHPSGRYLYVNGTGSNGAAIAAFSIAADTGALTPVAGSPYITGISAAAFAMDPPGKLMYAATRGNGNVGSIAMFRIDANTGALVVLGSSISLQLAPSSLIVDPSGKFVYVSSSSSNQLYSFSIDVTTGALVPLARAPVMRTGDRPVAVTVESSRGRPTPAVFASKFAYVANFADNTVSQYLFNAQSGALADSGTAFPAGTGPRALAAALDGAELFGSAQTDSTIAAFEINTTSGTLSLGRAAFPTSPAPVAIAVDASGRFVFVANSQTNTVSGYRFDQDTQALTANGPVANTTEAPVAVAVDPTGRVLFYVTNTSVGRVPIDLATGSLTTGTTIGVDAGATAIAADPTGRFVYVTIGTSPGSVRAFSINAAAMPALGTLTPIGTAATGAAPRAIVVDPTGRFVYTADSGSNSLSAFVINQATGELIAGSGIAVGTTPVALTVDVGGKFLYATNSTANSVSILAINTATGALTPVVAVPTGNLPVAIAIAGEVR